MQIIVKSLLKLIHENAKNGDKLKRAAVEL